MGWVRVELVLFFSVRFGSVRFGSVRLDSARLDSARFGSVRFGSVRFGSEMCQVSGSIVYSSLCTYRHCCINTKMRLSQLFLLVLAAWLGDCFVLVFWFFFLFTLRGAWRLPCHVFALFLVLMHMPPGPYIPHFLTFLLLYW